MRAASAAVAPGLGGGYMHDVAPPPISNPPFTPADADALAQKLAAKLKSKGGGVAKGVSLTSAIAQLRADVSEIFTLYSGAGALGFFTEAWSRLSVATLSFKILADLTDGQGDCDKAPNDPKCGRRTATYIRDLLVQVGTPAYLASKATATVYRAFGNVSQASTWEQKAKSQRVAFDSWLAARNQPPVNQTEHLGLPADPTRMVMYAGLGVAGVLLLAMLMRPKA